MNGNSLAMKEMAIRIRILILKALREVGSGHVGGSMSIADALAVLYSGKMRVDPNNPDWETRDRLVMSKGHAGPALYAALAIKGFFPEEELKTINSPGTRLPSHCDRNKTPGVDMTTGSLGQGMSTALGIALGCRIKNIESTTYLILGDGECDEGQVWEGALFAAAKKLNNVVAFVDENKKQLDGYTKDICDLGDIGQKFRAFGWYTQEVNGHDVDSISEAVDRAKTYKDGPSVIILDTVKGKGCSFVEGVFNNHHVSVKKEQADEEIQRLEKELECLRGVRS